jgi:hypothetical protein
MKYVSAQYAVPTTTCTVDTVYGKGKYLKMDLFSRLKPTFSAYLRGARQGGAGGMGRQARHTQAQARHAARAPVNACLHRVKP